MGRDSSGGSGARKIHASYIVTASQSLCFFPPVLCLLIRTELIGTQGTSAMLKAVDAFESEHPSQQWQYSSVKELRHVSKEHTGDRAS